MNATMQAKRAFRTREHEALMAADVLSYGFYSNYLAGLDQKSQHQARLMALQCQRKPQLPRGSK